jgi:thiamine-monophosphate kinase
MAARPGEFDIIARHFAPLARDGRVVTLGLKDDAAWCAQRAGFDLVMTADALVAGVHFLPDDPPDLVARKALRTNLSDLAAKGATPVAYLVCLALPKTIDEDWIAGFAAGLAQDNAAFDVALAGGDLTSTPGALTIAITALGEVPGGGMIQRRGARLGDAVWVSGTIGDAALGLGVISGEIAATDAARAHLIDRYRVPQPRVALGRRIQPIGVCGMDVSDGLVQDLGHIVALAGLGAELDAAAVPLSPAARAVIDADPRRFETAVTGGDDYELLVIAAADKGEALAAAARATATPLTRIGRIVAGEGVALRKPDGSLMRPARGGWSHFRGDEG